MNYVFEEGLQVSKGKYHLHFSSSLTFNYFIQYYGFIVFIYWIHIIFVGTLPSLLFFFSFILHAIKNLINQQLIPFYLQFIFVMKLCIWSFQEVLQVSNGKYDFYLSFSLTLNCIQYFRFIVIVI